MPQLSFVGPADGEVISLGSIQMRILEDGHTTDHRLGIGEITIAPHTGGPPQHRHAQHDEGFYVVAGRARFTVGEAIYEAPVGTLVMIPQGVPHTFANPGDQPAVLLNTFTPDQYVQYFRDLRELAANNQPLTPEATIQIMNRYATSSATDLADVAEHQPELSNRKRKPNMTTEPLTRTIHWRPDLPLTFTESGSGRIVLLLHGGGGPFTVQSIATHLSQTMHVILPTHPGWNGAERPAWLNTVPDLARVYIQMLISQGYQDVLVIGSSLGGWVASEMALNDDRGTLSGLVVIDGTGVEIPGQPIRDFYALDARGIAEYSYHHPERFYIDPATIPPEQAARQRTNMATMRIFAGERMYDQTLFARLGQIRLPSLFLWGESDRIVTPAYGQAFASAIPNARFAVIADAGHLPHFEQPQATFDALDAFAARR